MIKYKRIIFVPPFVFLFSIHFVFYNKCVHTSAVSFFTLDLSKITQSEKHLSATDCHRETRADDLMQNYRSTEAF